MGILSPLDLIYTFPRAWEDRRLRFSIREAPMGESVTLRVKIESIQFSVTRNNLGIANALVSDKSGKIQAAWFKKLNPRYDVFVTLRDRLQVGRDMIICGSVEWGPSGKQIRVEDMALCPEGGQALSEADRMHFDRIVPLYTTPEGINEHLLRSLIGSALSSAGPLVGEILPASLLRKHYLSDRLWAFQKIHFPGSMLEKEQARERLALEEFLCLETALGLIRQQIKRQPKTHRFQLKRTLLTPFKEALGFRFTEAQKRVIREIFEDLMKDRPMHRLLQGDVGSGKTVVALSAMLLAVESGGQAALMAPTEILAEQHALTFQRYLSHLPVRFALITGRQPPAQRKAALNAISSGEVSLVIGTHAVIQKTVRFKNLMLAVVDEQHRFGVEHRSLLRQKGVLTDVLVMTATPIPRTLALTVYGDLDVSVLDHLPPGRTPVNTRHVTEEEAYTAIRNIVSEGHQAYLVFPLVEESDKLELKAVVQEALVLQQTFFQQLRVGVLHGQLPPLEKERIMEKFRAHQLDILIATSIIEVGIDVPNATLMAIQHAERFGLATLHQLRGRVGRGPTPSTCLLIAQIKTEDARKRIEVMEQTTDGFRISEEDLSLRGPGEVLGAMQHGLPGFKLGHLVKDARLIQQARSAAEALLEADPNLKQPENQALKCAVLSQFGAKWSLGSTA